MQGVFLLLGATVYQRHSPSAKHTRLPPHPFRPWLNPVIRLLGSHMPAGRPLPGIPTPCPWLSPSSPAVTSSTPPRPTLIEDLASCHQHTAAARRQHLRPPPTCALPVTRALPPPVPPPIPAAPSVRGQPAPQLSADPTATCATSSLCPQSRTPHTRSLPVLWLTFDSLRAAFCPHTLLTGPSKVSNALHRLPWPCPIGRQRRGTRPHSRALRGARPSRPVTPGDSWPSPAGPADPPLPGADRTIPAQAALPAARPPPGLHSSRGGGPSATGSTERTVGRPLWGKTCKRLQPSAQDQTSNRHALGALTLCCCKEETSSPEGPEKCLWSQATIPDYKDLP